MSSSSISQNNSAATAAPLLSVKDFEKAALTLTNNNRDEYKSGYRLAVQERADGSCFIKQKGSSLNMVSKKNSKGKTSGFKFRFISKEESEENRRTLNAFKQAILADATITNRDQLASEVDELLRPATLDGKIRKPLTARFIAGVLGKSVSAPPLDEAPIEVAIAIRMEEEEIQTAIPIDNDIQGGEPINSQLEKGKNLSELPIAVPVSAREDLTPSAPPAEEVLGGMIPSAPDQVTHQTESRVTRLSPDEMVAALTNRPVSEIQREREEVEARRARELEQPEVPTAPSTSKRSIWSMISSFFGSSSTHAPRTTGLEHTSQSPKPWWRFFSRR